MPLNVATLQSQTREFDLPYLGEQLHVEYRPGLITPSGDALAMADWIPTVVTSWDLVGLDGTVVPLDPDALRALPDNFLRAVTEGVLRNSRLDPTTSGSSADG